MINVRQGVFHLRNEEASYLFRVKDGFLEHLHFGARADGIYLLEGASDAGRPIKSGIALGQHDFGSQALKNINAVYVGVSSTGALFLKVGDGRTHYTYRARRNDPHMKVQRFDVGRGLRTNYFTFELTSEADAFELGSVTFHVLASQRRI